MKQILTFVLLLLACAANAQPIEIVPTAQAPAVALPISWAKTTFLVFPAPVLHADRGEKYILAGKLKDATNILRVKAGQKGFENSNLNVVTADGKIYSFEISYAEDAPSLPVYIGKLSPFAPVTFPGLSLNSPQVAQYAAAIAARPPDMNKARFHKHEMDFRLQGIYIKDDVLFVRYLLKNNSAINYREPALRFYVRDKKKARRTAVQDKEMVPLQVETFGTPEAPGGQCIIAAFARFTIAEKKYFTAELMERDGDRNPYSRLDQGLLLKARPLR